MRLIRASLPATLLVAFIGLGSSLLAFGPFPPVHHPHHASLPGATLPFIATAYCHAGVTQSGVDTHSGIAAADPAELPVGSVVQVDTDILNYNGIYTVLDTGAKVQGQTLDLFVRDCDEAQHFGRRAVHVTVLRRGWSPKASAPKAVVAGVAGR